MNETEQTFWELLKKNWLTVGGGLFLIFSIYTNDAGQTKNIGDLEQRVSTLEKDRADSNTKWAVLQVQLTAIQTDLTDIKAQLKVKP